MSFFATRHFYLKIIAIIIIVIIIVSMSIILLLLLFVIIIAIIFYLLFFFFTFHGLVVGITGLILPFPNSNFMTSGVQHTSQGPLCP